MDFFEFAEQVALMAQLLKAQQREIVYVKVGRQFVKSIDLKDSGDGCDNLDVVITLR